MDVAKKPIVINHFIHLILSMWFLLLVSTLHVVVAKLGKLCGCREQPFVNITEFAWLWIHYESPLLWELYFIVQQLYQNWKVLASSDNFLNDKNRPIYIGKNQNPKNLGFLLYHLHCQKNPSHSGFLARKAHTCAKKPESHTCVLVSGAHARLLSTFDRTRVVRITSRAAVGWFRWRSRTTWPKTRIIPARLERAFTLTKTSEILAEMQKITLRRWVFRFVFFWSGLGEVA